MVNEEVFMIQDGSILYGDLRCCRDFKYIFNHCSFSDAYYGATRCDKVKALVSMGLSPILIVCSFDKEEACKELDGIGLIKGVNYKLADDYFEDLDLNVINFRKKYIYIWGCGFWGKKALSKLKGSVEGFIDTNERYSECIICGKSVFLPEQISDDILKESFIVISPQNYYSEIKDELVNRGLKYKDDFIYANKLFVSELIKKTFYDKAYYDFKCESTFRVFEVESTGDISNCCSTLIKTRSGNLFFDDYDDIWNDLIHRVECLSINNRTFSFCIPTSCPALIGREQLEIRDELAETIIYKEIPKKPEYLHLSIDDSCNLYCESCRECIKVNKGKDLNKSLYLRNKILNSPLKEVKELYIAGNGEVFLSKVYESIWKSDLANNANTIRILSNGMLLTRDKWNEFYRGKEKVNIWLYVSIDAATKETYESIRRGGRFDILKENMEFVSMLRKKGIIQYLRINFVVQRKNYLEMERFVEWGMELGVDNVFFTKLLNWGTYSEEEFDAISMIDGDSMCPRPELQRVLDKPIFSNEIVDIGTIQYKRNRKLPDYVDNYYVWETKDWMEMKISNSINI